MVGYHVAVLDYRGMQLNHLFNLKFLRYLGMCKNTTRKPQIQFQNIYFWIWFSGGACSQTPVVGGMLMSTLSLHRQFYSSFPSPNLKSCMKPWVVLNQANNCTLFITCTILSSNTSPIACTICVYWSVILYVDDLQMHFPCSLLIWSTWADILITASAVRCHWTAVSLAVHISVPQQWVRGVVDGQH